MLITGLNITYVQQEILGHRPARGKAGLHIDMATIRPVAVGWSKRKSFGSELLWTQLFERD